MHRNGRKGKKRIAAGAVDLSSAWNRNSCSDLCFPHTLLPVIVFAFFVALQMLIQGACRYCYYLSPVCTFTVSVCICPHISTCVQE